MSGRDRGPSRRPEALYYRDAVRFPDQIERYFAAFGADRVKVIIYDHFAADPSAAHTETLRFLGVDETFRPELGVVNESKRPRIPAIQALIVPASRPGGKGHSDLAPVPARSSTA